MRKALLFAMAAVLPATLPATGALANPCGFDESRRMVVKGYGVGQTAIPVEEKRRLAEFAETAKFRDGVCVFAQVDEQGSKEANVRVATRRAENVRSFLISQGVPARAIETRRQVEAFTLFGLLPSDQSDDRRVYVTHN